MMEVFEGMVTEKVLIYIDGILIFGRTFEDHLRAPQTSFERLVKANV